MRCRWMTCGAILAIVLGTALAKPNHVTEERREYYQRSSKIIDGTPTYYTTGMGSSGLSSSWAQNHMDEVRKMADRLKLEYNAQAQQSGGRHSGYRARTSFSSGSQFDYPNFTGKTKEELDVITREMTEKIISDMKSGKLGYSQISQPNWFENQAAQQLEALSHQQHHSEDLQQQQQNIFGAEDLRQVQQQVAGGYHKTTEKKHYEYSSSHGGYQPVPTYATELESLNQREEKNRVTYPTTLTIVGGNSLSSRRNCSTSRTGSRSPYFTNYRSRTNYDRAGERTVPIVIGQSQSNYEKEESSQTSQKETESVPVYPGSYFTDSQYDEKYSQTQQGRVPIQTQTTGQSSDIREDSHHQHHYTIPISGSQTVSSSSTTVQEREHQQQMPVVFPSQQTITSESYNEHESQKQVPITIPTGSSSVHRESSSYESTRERQREYPRPITTTSSTSSQSMYRQSEQVPNYKPQVVVDEQTIESLNQQVNRYQPQVISTVVHGEELKEEQERQTQQNIVVPDVTFTAHEQETINQETRNQHVQPSTIHQGTSQETSHSSVHYRPSYPAYGSQIGRNDTQYHSSYHTRYPQQVAGSSKYENEEEFYTEESQRQVPVHGQTYQTVEETNRTENYRTGNRGTPVVVGGTTYKEDREEYTEEGQKQIPVQGQEFHSYEQTNEQSENYRTGQRTPVIVGGITYSENREEYTEDSQRQVPVQGYEITDQYNKTEQYTGGRQSRPIYTGSTSHRVTSSADYNKTEHYQSPQYRPTQTTSETEETYWSERNRRPGSVPVVTGSEYEENEIHSSSHSRYPQGGVISQTSVEEEMEGVSTQRRPGQAGYIVSTQYNESASSSSGHEGGQYTVTGSEHVVTGSEEDTQVQQRPEYTGGFQIDSERNESSQSSSSGQYPSGVGYGQSERESSGHEYNSENYQRPHGYQTEHSERGSQYNVNISSGAGGIGYITHQLTIEQQREEWRRQEEERRRQLLLTGGVVDENDSSLNISFGQGSNGNVQVNLHPHGVYDGDEQLRNTDQTHYGSSLPERTSTSGKPPKKVISKDRGDQPPQHYEEEYDMEEVEPGIGSYPAEPDVANLQGQPEPTTPRYEPPYKAPLAPLDEDHDSSQYNQQSTVDVWPTTAGEAEVQRTYHRKKTTITSTIPVLLGGGEVTVQGSGNVLTSDSLTTGVIDGQQQESSSGSYYSSSGSDTQQRENIESGSGGAYHSSSSSSQQSGGSHGGYGSSVYGSEAQYSSGSGSSNRSQYITGSSSSSTSYQSGGSYSQASAYGHQQIEDDEEGALQKADVQSSIDFDLGEQVNDQSEYSEDLQQQQQGLPPEFFGKEVRSSYSQRESSSSTVEKEIPATVEEVKEEETTEKTGFWKKLGEKARNVFG